MRPLPPGSPCHSSCDFVGYGLPDDYSPDHVYAIDFPDWGAAGLDTCQLAGPEDILFDYTESGADTRHQRDWARALALAEAMGDDLDLGYVFSKAEWRRDGAFVAAVEKVLRGEPLKTK